MLMNKQIIMRMLNSNINNIESINQIKFCNFRTDIYTLGIMVQWCSISYISYIFLNIYFNVILTVILVAFYNYIKIYNVT